MLRVLVEIVIFEASSVDFEVSLVKFVSVLDPLSSSDELSVKESVSRERTSIFNALSTQIVG